MSTKFQFLHYTIKWGEARRFHFDSRFQNKENNSKLFDIKKKLFIPFVINNMKTLIFCEVRDILGKSIRFRVLVCNFYVREFFRFPLSGILPCPSLLLSIHFDNRELNDFKNIFLKYIFNFLLPKVIRLIIDYGNVFGKVYGRVATSSLCILSPQAAVPCSQRSLSPKQTGLI